MTIERWKAMKTALIHFSSTSNTEKLQARLRKRVSREETDVRSLG